MMRHAGSIWVFHAATASEPVAAVPEALASKPARVMVELARTMPAAGVLLGATVATPTRGSTQAPASPTRRNREELELTQAPEAPRSPPAHELREQGPARWAA